MKHVKSLDYGIKEHKMKKTCKTCIYYRDIKGEVGYCTFLRILNRKGVLILDTKETMDSLRTFMPDDVEPYKNVVVRSIFGCISHAKL